jgi:hypothetical protein
VKPTAFLTPMGIYPLGLFDGEVRFFGPSWHGFSGMYGRMAKTLMLLARLFRNPELERLALGNIQWIAGLNAGGVDTGGMWTGLSLINGIGGNCLEPWTGIPGSIVNGFCANPQFRMAHLDDCLDAPAYLSKEDWIVYNGQWLSGISEVERPSSLLIRTCYRGRAVRAAVHLPGEEKPVRTNPRGLYKAELPAGKGGVVRVEWEAAVIEASLLAIAGYRNELILDFADHLAVSLDLDRDRRQLLVRVENRGRDRARVALVLRCMGVDPDREKIRVILGAGKEASVKVRYRLDCRDIPRYVLVQGTARYSYAETELSWLQ